MMEDEPINVNEYQDVADGSPVTAEAVDKQDQKNLSTTLILPDTRLREPKKRVFQGLVAWIPIFCANCGADGGLVPEENCNFAFYLCNPCAEKYGNVEGTYMEPDAVFWQKVHDEQMEKYGRILTPAEIEEQLKDGGSPLSKLCRDRKDFERKAKGG